MKTKPKKSAVVKPKRILIVDDHPMMRDGLAALIGAEADLVVCGQAADAREAMSAIASLRPDLVLVDVSMPGKSGLELVKDIEALAPGLAVLVLSVHDEPLFAESVLRSGARGYVIKQEGGKRIMDAIRTVLEGKVFVSDKMAARGLDRFSGKRSAGNSASVPQSAPATKKKSTP